MPTIATMAAFVGRVTAGVVARCGWVGRRRPKVIAGVGHDVPTMGLAVNAPLPTISADADHRACKGADQLNQTLPGAMSKPTFTAATKTLPQRIASNLEKGAAGRALLASEIATAFLHWAVAHRVPGADGRDVAVDDLWSLAEEGFGPACGIVLPPRRVFLGALQKLAGVRVRYDVRVRDRGGKVIRKTTYYRLGATAQTWVRNDGNALRTAA